MKSILRALLLALAVGVCSAQTTTTISEETKNNTSACGTDFASRVYCDQTYGAFTGWTDNRPGLSVPVLTPLYDSAPANVSKGRGTFGDVHNLLPAGMQDILIFPHLQWWFTGPRESTVTLDGVGYSFSGSHKMNGSMDCAKTDCLVGTAAVNAKKRVSDFLDDLWQRGYDGVMGNYPGGRATCGNGTLTFTASCGVSSSPYRRDVAYLYMINDMVARYPTMKFSFVYDDAAYKFGSNCGPGSGFAPGEAKQLQQVRCVEGKIRADFAWMKANYFNKSVYWKIASGNVVSFFDCEGCFPLVYDQCTASTPCAFIDGTTCTSSSGCHSSLRSKTKSYVTGTLGVAVKWIYRNASGFTKGSSDGAFAWIDPPSQTGSAITIATQLNWKNGSSLDTFYDTASTQFDAGKIVIAQARAGADHHAATWHANGGSILAQQCGQVWLNNFTAMTVNGDFSPSKKPHALQVITWDDYEEGSEVETGIRNCGKLTGGVSQGLLTWNQGNTDATYFALRTIDHLTVYGTTDGSNLRVLANNIPPATSGTVNLDNLGLAAGTYSIWVKSWGKPGIQNLMANAGSYTSVGGPVIDPPPPPDPPPVITPPPAPTGTPTPKPTPRRPPTYGTRGITIV